MKLLNKKLKLAYFLALLVAASVSLLAVIGPLVSGDILNQLVASARLPVRALIIFGIVSLLQLFSGTMWVYQQLSLVREIKNFLRQKIVAYSFKSGRFAAKNLSDAITDINVNAEAVAENYVKAEIEIILALIMIVASSVALFFLNVPLALVILGISLLNVWFPKFFSKFGAKNRQQLSNAQSFFIQRFSSFLNGIETIFNFNRTKFFVTASYDDNQQVVVTEKKANLYATAVNGITYLLNYCNMFIIIVLGAYFVEQKTLEIGSLLAIIQISTVLSSPLALFSFLIYGRNEAKPLVETIEKYLVAYPEKNKATVAVTSVQLADVAVAVNDELILSQVNLTLTSGEKYLLVGRSGSGKSTLLRAITGNMPYTGQITVNQELLPQDLLGIDLITQKPAIFNLTLRDNLTLGKEIAPEAVAEMISFLELDYLAARNGEQLLKEEELSGGEKQRIALGRALLGKPQVLLLDEFNSGLDPALAEKLERKILQLDCIVLHVTHHLNPAFKKNYQAIFTVEDKGIKRMVREEQG